MRFNDELWRIIGVMNNVDDGTGKKESRIKLIREESIGAFSWDSSPMNINSGLGVNEWSQSDLSVVLNDYYYNGKTNQFCYNGSGNTNVTCSFSQNGLTSDSKNYFSKVLWNTGSNATNEPLNFLIKDFYNYERGAFSGKICTEGINCNDTIERTTKWIGYIGLIYISDYGFATGTNTISRESCLNQSLYGWDIENYQSCKDGNWIIKNNKQMTLSVSGHPTSASYPFTIYPNGSVRRDSACYAYPVYPSLYLKSEIKIISGTGSNLIPFELSLN